MKRKATGKLYPRKSVKVQITAPSGLYKRQLMRTGGRMPASSNELKDLTLSLNALIPDPGSTTSLLYLLNGCAQGTTASTRLGRRIIMKSLFMKYVATMAATSTLSTALRFLVVYDKQTNATAPTVTDILLSDLFSSPMNLSNSRRFKVLVDKIVPCIGTAGPQSVAFNIYKKINLPVEFNTGSAGTVGDIQTGSVYILCQVSGVNIGVAEPLNNMYTRIRFSDN